MNSKRKPLNKLFIILNIFVVLIYLLVCLVPVIDPGKFWYISLLGLAFPLLFFAVLFFFISSLLFKSNWALLSFLALIFSWQQISAVFKFYPPRSFNVVKATNNLRLLSWNVSSWDEFNKAKRGGTSYRDLMFEEVRKTNSDILCFQEFLESTNPAGYEPNIPELQKMGYPYHYYIRTQAVIDNTEMGMVIFSKYAIINTGSFDFKDKGTAQQVIYADVKFKNETIRVITIHLQSVKFGKEEYISINEIKHTDKEGLKDSKNIISKLKRAYPFRKYQAEVVNEFVKKSPYPVILCGDFNDVPNSYAYFTIKGNMQDAFLKKGSGIGRTFRFISPTLRIDYIFAGKKFDVTQYHRLTVPYSDHYGIMADFYINPAK